MTLRQSNSIVRGRWLVLCAIALASAVAGGCNPIQTVDGTKIRRNLPVTKVPGKFGPPDIVGQSSAGSRRYYFLDGPPAEVWNAKDLETYYFYVDRGYKLVITDDRVRDSASISQEETDVILPMIHARRATR